MSKPYTGPSHNAWVISELEQGYLIHDDGSVSQFVRELAMEEQELKAFRRTYFWEYKRLYTAVATANLHRWVLNTLVTICWHSSSNRAYPKLLAQSELLNRMRAWFQRKGRSLRGGSNYLPCAAVWTCEPGRSDVPYTQLLVHVPYELQDKFRLWLTGAVDRVIRQWDPEHCADYSPYLVLVSPNFDCDTTSQWKLFRYITDGLEAAEALQLLHDDHSRLFAEEFGEGFPPPPHIVKYVGSTASIGNAALERLKHLIAVPTIWPKGASVDEGLAYDDRFLLAGEKAWARANKGA